MPFIMLKHIKIFVKQIMVYFFYAGKPELINPIYYVRKIINWISKKKIRRINNGELHRYIEQTMDKSGSTGCEYTDYLTLWKYLETNEPQSILECGSGFPLLYLHITH